jgi:hypothetical protein
MKDKNRIEIVGAYYLRIVIGKHKLESDKFYELKSSVLRAAKDLSAILILPIYDFDGDGMHYREKYKIIEPNNCQFKRTEFGQLKLLNGSDVVKLWKAKDARVKLQDRWCGRGPKGPVSNYMCGRG